MGQKNGEGDQCKQCKLKSPGGDNADGLDGGICESLHVPQLRRVWVISASKASCSHPVESMWSHWQQP